MPKCALSFTTLSEIFYQNYFGSVVQTADDGLVKSDNKQRKLIRSLLLCLLLLG
jgi:hypothetical protein